MSKMTVSELHELLGKLIERGCGNHKLGIPYVSVTPKMGSSPSAGIVAIDEGFDWDRGTVFLRPSIQLAQGDQVFMDMRKDLGRLRDSLYMIKPLTILELTHTEKQVGKKEVDPEFRLKTIMSHIEHTLGIIKPVPVFNQDGDSVKCKKEDL